MSRIRNPTWENNENLKADIQKYVLQNLPRKEVLDFLGRDYPQHAWSLPTLSRRMASGEGGGGGGLLGISSDGDDRRIFLGGFEIFDSGTFLGTKIWQVFFWVA